MLSESEWERLRALVYYQLTDLKLLEVHLFVEVLNRRRNNSEKQPCSAISFFIQRVVKNEFDRFIQTNPWIRKNLVNFYEL